MPYTSAKRTQRRYDRGERVRAGAPDPKFDWRCPICQKWFSTYRRRDELHLRACQAKEERRIVHEERRRARMARPVPSPEHISPPSTPDPTVTIPQASTILEPSNAGDDEGERHLSNDPGPPSSNVSGPTNVGIPGMSSSLVFLSSLYSNRIDPSQPNIWSTQSVARDPVTWPLELGETLVVYHPHARLPPRVFPTTELAAFSRCPGNTESLRLNDPRPPYFPFKSLADFEQTEIFVKRDHTDSEINDQLSLWGCHANGEGVTLKNAREMHRCLEAAGVEEDLSQVKL
jgi:hypothetical protein